ncbi:MAG: MFS transporter [Thermoplasmata archaeon]|nr:MFS transporter [Candidatus Sysuiplasma acidicola]MBX8645153.1 MFS transporter [Candidatus Sysuiplasma acidicola]MDH2906127.1 MFS transporter [Methanomassiliicoccales archaeon]
MTAAPHYGNPNRIVFAAWLGWLMDGYVTISYLIQVGTVSPLFFPASLSLFYFLAFGVNGVARALGSAVLGNFIGDRIGRKRMLVLTVGLFSLSTASLGLLPTYQQAGIIVSVAVFVLLFLMGIFAGAEYGGGTALSMESVPPEKRNLYGAFVQSGFGCGYAILAGVFTLIYLLTGPAGYATIGWRLLFLSTLVPGILTLFIRSLTPESQVFEETERKGAVEKTPLLKMFREVWGRLAAVVMITAGLLYINASTFSLYPLILETVNGFKNGISGIALIVINLISIAGVILGGFFAARTRDRAGYILKYTVLFLVISLPVDLFAFGRNVFLVMSLFSVQAFFEAMIFSTLPALMSEAFSKRYRTTAVGFAYNLGATFGAFALVIVPLTASIAGWGTAWISNILVAGVLMMAGTALSLSIWSARDDAGKLDLITE